jgi:PAS domain S-box-containing protein
VSETSKDHNSFLKAILRFHSDSVLILNKEGIIQYRNDAINPTLGWQPADLVNTPVLHYIHGQDQDLFRTSFHQTLADNVSRMLIYRVLNKEGQYKWLESEMINLEDFEDIRGLLLRSRDITDKVEAEAREKKNKAFYESLFFNHPDAVARWDAAGRVEEINASTVLLFGFEQAEAVGRHILSFFDPVFAPVVLEAFQKTLKGTPASFRARIIHKNGTVMETSTTLIPVLLDGKVEKVQGITQDVTELVRANERLQEQERVQCSIFESINEGFYALDRRWRFTYVNKVCAATFRKTKEELLNTPLTDILEPRFPDITTSLFLQKCQEVAQTGQAVAFQEHFPLENTNISFKIYPLEDGLAVHFIDITQQVADQQEVQKLSLVASKINNGVLILDATGGIEWTNDSFISFTGYTLEETQGKEAGDLVLDIRETGKEAFARIGASITRGVPFSEDVVLRHKKGSKRWFHAEMTPVPGPTPQDNKFYVVFSDISQRKAAEEKLLQQADDLFAQQRDLQQFTYIVSHILRAPVANVIGLADLLGDTPPDSPDFPDTLSKLEESVARLDAVIHYMNTVLTIRTKSQTEAKRRVVILEVCQEVKESLQECLAAVDGELDLELDPSWVLHSHKAYLYSVFYNLVVNSLQYRSADRQLQIRIQAAPTPEGGLEIAISDNGMGMDMDKVGNDLFKLYTRFSSATEGKGIGLFLVKTQVEALGGKIEVDSAPDQGTTIRLFFNPEESKVLEPEAQPRRLSNSPKGRSRAT